MKELNTWKEVIEALIAGEEVQYYLEASEVWVDFLYSPSIPINELTRQPRNRCRIKVKTTLIGDMEVPEPVRSEEEFNEGDTYYYVSPTDEDLYEWAYWDNERWDLLMIKRGMIHKTKEAAVIHAKALIKISGGNYDHS